MLLDFTDTIHDTTKEDILDRLEALKNTNNKVRELALSRSLTMLSRVVKDKLANVQQKTLKHIEEFTAISDNVEKSNNFIAPLNQIKEKMKHKDGFNQQQWKKILAYHYSDQKNSSKLSLNNPILNKYAQQLTVMSL